MSSAGATALRRRRALLSRFFTGDEAATRTPHAPRPVGTRSSLRLIIPPVVTRYSRSAQTCSRSLFKERSTSWRPSARSRHARLHRRNHHRRLQGQPRALLPSAASVSPATPPPSDLLPSSLAPLPRLAGPRVPTPSLDNARRASRPAPPPAIAAPRPASASRSLAPRRRARDAGRLRATCSAAATASPACG